MDMEDIMAVTAVTEDITADITADIIGPRWVAECGTGLTAADACSRCSVCSVS